MKRVKPLLLAVLLLVVFAACRKSERDRDTSLGSVEDELRAQAMYLDLFSVVNEAAKATAGIRSFTSHLSCATITTDTLASPRIMTIDFGTANCMGTDGKTRRGKLYCTFTGNYSDSLTLVTVTPLNYYLNDHKADGTITLTQNGTNANAQPVINLKVSNGKITPASPEWNLYWACNYMITQTGGSGTTASTDDVFSITGTSNATGRHGESFGGSIQTPLIYQWNCGELVAGENDVVPQGINIRHIDYGTLECDANVLVNIQGYEYEIHNMY